MPRRRIIALLAFLAVVLAGAVLVFRGGATPVASSPSATIPPVAASTSVVGDGRAVPVATASLSVAAPGRVAETLVREGDRVTAGQPLVRLDTAAADANVAEAEASLAAARAEASQSDAAARQANASVDAASAGVAEARAGFRQADATRDGLPSVASANQKRSANESVNRASAALRAAQAQLQAAREAKTAARSAATAAHADANRAKAALDAAKAALAELTVTAPIAGRIASLDAAVGEQVSPEAPVVRIEDPSKWQFETTNLDETAVGRVSVGDPATVTLDAFPDNPVQGTVSRIGNFGETVAGDITYTVVVDPTSPVPDGVRWNMTATVSIDVGQ
ncbi:MAG: HlyD family secretion protein [Chloroflexota bacterium]